VEFLTIVNENRPMSVAGERLAPGSVLAGYRIQGLVGRGGMGEVYLAHDDQLGRDVALKVLPPELVDDADFRARLERESRLAASLDHPNVVTVYRAGESDGVFYLAMRYVDGTDLRALLRREGTLSPERAVAVAEQVAAALDAAHEHGLVHRDVKPSNVLIGAAGGVERCYLADFGLSQTLADRGVPTDGRALGTLDYVAPEQIRGDDVDGHADVYALGCLLFECLTGEVPFPRASEVATIYAHLEEPPPVPSERRPDLPGAADPVLARAMAKEPEERQPTCGTLVEELRDALGLAPPQPARTRWIVAGLVALLAVAAAAVAVAALVTDGGGAPAVTGGSLVHVNARSNDVVATTRVPGYPGAVAVAPGGVWTADFRDGVLWRHDPRSGALQRVSSTGEPRDLAALGADVYVASDGPKVFSGNVTRYEASTGVREDAIERLACAVASGEGVVWVAGCPSVQRLSTDGGPLRELRETFIPYAERMTAENHRIQIREMAVGHGSLWVLGDPIDRRLWRLDRRTGRMQAVIPLGFMPRTVAAGAGGVWITDPLRDRVVRVDPVTNRIGRAITVPSGAAGVAVGADSVWVASSLDGSVTRIDPATGRVTATIAVDGRPREVAVSGDDVWVTTHAR
jgi:YVTN family beta-propeller protein